MKIGPRLHRIGNDIVAAYLIDTEEGVTVIDPGLPGHWRDLRRELAAMGRTTADVRGIVLTHGDSDHVGFAERLRKQTGIPVYVHAADADRAKGGDKPKSSGGSMKFGAALGFFGYALSKGGLRTHYLTDVREVQGGDALTTRHVLTGRTGPQPAPFTDEPDEALASLALLATVEASWVLPGHGAPWRAKPGEVAAQVRDGGR